MEAIFIAPHGSQPMERVDEVRAVTGGLEGDRYLLRRGYWTAVDECEVTLIEAEAIEEIQGPSGPSERGRRVSVSNGEHRRNIVTRGVTLRDLAGTRFRVGEAVLAYDRPRPPCRYVESITEPGMTRALAARRGGICARVVEPGRIRVGDSIEVIAGAPPERSGVVRRLLRG